MADYTEDELYAKLERADAAGDVEAARVIASEIRRVQSANKPKAQAPVSGEMTLSDLITGRKPQPWDYNPTNIHALDGVARQVGAGVDALQHHVMNPIHGLAQLGGHALEAAMPDGSSAEAYFRRSNAQDDAYATQRERDYQTRTGDTAASYVGGAVGEVLPWLYGVGEAKALGLLPKLKKVSEVPTVLGKVGNVAAKTGLLAGEGAVMGAAAPVTEDRPYWDAKVAQVGTGAVMAPVAAVAGAGASKATQGATYLGRLMTPAGRETIASQRFAKMLEGDPQAVAALGNAQAIVPGEAPSIAQVLTHDPKYLQMERALRNNPHAGPAFVAQDTANDAARMDVIKRLAGTDDALEQAIAARRANARAFRDANLPETGSALVEPQGIMAVLSKLTLDGDPTVAGAARRHMNLLTQHAEANGGKVPAWALDNIHQNVGETLGAMKTNGPVTSKQVARYAPVKAQIVDALDGAVPGYRDYLSAYARDSAPINDMGAARAILDPARGGGWNAGGDQVARAGRINTAIRADDRADFPMTDAARTQIEAVRDSLLRRSISDNKVAASGPGTAAEMGGGLLDSPIVRKAATGSAGLLGLALGSGVGPVGSAAGSIVGGLLAEAGQAARGNILAQIGKKAANADEARRALQAVREMERKRQQSLLTRVPQYLLPYSH